MALKEFIKDILKVFLQFLKKNYILIIAAITMIVPDLLVRSVVREPIFEKSFFNWGPALIFTLCWVFFLLPLIRRLPSIIGRFVYLILSLVIYILAFANFIHYLIFEQFFWITSIGLAGEAGGYFKYAMGFVTPFLAIITIVNLGLIIFVTVKWTVPEKERGIPGQIATFLIPVLVIVGLHISLQPSVAGVLEDDWDSWRKPHVVYKDFTDANKSLTVAGYYQFIAKDLWKMWFPHNQYSEEEYAEIDKYFDTLPEPQQNEHSSILKGKNVIAVMMESIDDWLIDEKHTPAICYMMENGINFTDYNAPLIGSGCTFNSEFAFNTGYYTPKSTVTAVSFSANSFPYSMPNLFKNEGYRVNSYHYNISEFYNRGIMHKSLGYERYNSLTDFGLTLIDAQSDSNILLGDEVYNDMIKKTPFFNFVITYSGHIPYTYDDPKLHTAKHRYPELIDQNEDLETNNLRILARDTDEFFANLLYRLNKDGLLEDTVIIAFTDHYAYGFSNEEKLMEYSSGLLTRVPAFIYTPGLEHKEISKPMHTIDWLPTVVNMFGLENQNCYIGHDIFDERHDGFVHFEHALWYDGETYFVPNKTQITPENEEYIKSQCERANEILEINDVVISGDYFKKRK